MRPVVKAEARRQRPVDQIGRPVDLNVIATGNRRDPRVTLAMVEHFRIAKNDDRRVQIGFVRLDVQRKNRIGRVFRPGST